MNKIALILSVVIAMACTRESSVYWPLNTGTLSVIPNGDTLVYLAQDSSEVLFYRTNYSEFTSKVNEENTVEQRFVEYTRLDTNWTWSYNLTAGDNITDTMRFDVVIVDFSLPISTSQTFDFGSGKYIYSSAYLVDSVYIDNRAYEHVYITQGSSSGAFMFNEDGIPAFADEQGNWYHFEEER